MLRAKQQIAIKQEGTAGTAETLANTDAILHSGVAEFEPDVQMTNIEAMSGTLSQRGSVPGTRAAKIRFSMRLGGSYNHSTGASAAVVASSTEAPWHVPMLGAGFASTISGGAGSEQNSYKPSSTTISDETTGAYCTVALYEDGKKYMIHGAQASACRFIFNVGEPVMAEFEFLGVYNAPTDVALLGSVVYPTFVPPVFLGASLSIPTSFTTAKVRSLTLDMGLETIMRPYPNSTNGLFTAQIVRRRPVGTIDPEEVLAATENIWDHWLSGTVGALTTGVFPSSGSNNNQLSLNIPVAAYTKVGLGDRDGMSNLAVEFECRANSAAGDDEVEIIQT